MHNSNSTRVIVFALLANFGIAVAKFIGAVISNSTALTAEAIHSFVDCGNQILLLIGQKKSKKRPTESHPLGYGAEAFFWSFVVSILLFSLGGVFAIYEGIHKLSSHEEVASPLLGIIILGVSLGIEGFSFHACLKEVRLQNKFENLWVWFRKTTSSELLVIFTEDAAAMAGLVLATLSLSMSWMTGNAIWDAVGSIAVGVLLVLVAIVLGIEIKSLIIGEAPSTDFRSFIESRLKERIPGGKLYKLIALQIGVYEVMMSCKISPGEIKEVEHLVNAINALERDIKLQFPEVKWLFVEPDSKD